MDQNAQLLSRMLPLRKERFVFVFLAITSLLTGLIAGLGRIGWDPILLNAVPQHGAIMVGGFLGTLITLEKIIPLKRPYLYAFPLISGMSVVLFLTGHAIHGYILLICASAGMFFVTTIYLSKNPNLIYLLMTVGAGCWLAGNIRLATSNFYPLAIPPWMAFALFIISAERIELMKFMPVSELSKKLFASLLFAFLVCSALSFHGWGGVLSGIMLMAIAIWLLRFDVIAISMRKSGLTKFMALALCSGYISLLITGLFLILFNAQPFSYDVIVHTFFIGFVFSMIFAHGPVILPGVLGSSVKPFAPQLYIWLFLLHASLWLRIGSDSLGLTDVRKISGVITSLSIIGYFANVAFLLIKQGASKWKSTFGYH